MVLHLKIKPGRRQNKIFIKGDTILVEVKAPPVDGKANKELVAYLSEIFGIPKSKIEISAGLGSSFKTLRIPSEYEENIKKTITDLRS